jgi:soluble lytic murein transglycosylase-like protein
MKLNSLHRLLIAALVAWPLWGTAQGIAPPRNTDNIGQQNNPRTQVVNSSHASNQQSQLKEPNDFASFSGCFEASAQKYHIAPRLLIALAYVESSFNPNAVGARNSNGTTDLGLMQINSAWLPALHSRGLTQDDLMKPCVSLDVAGWILANNIRAYGNTWEAVGYYNSGQLRHQRNYVALVQDALSRINQFNPSQTLSPHRTETPALMKRFEAAQLRDTESKVSYLEEREDLDE